MRYRALILLGIAVVLGGLAAYTVNSIVSQEISVQDGMVSQQVQPAVVAGVDLTVGTTLDSPMLRIVDMPLDAYPAGSFASVDEVLATTPAVVITPISAGEVILPAKLSGGVSRRGLTAKIPDGMRAITIPVDEIRGVAGFVLPGDHIDILHTTSVGRRDEKPVTRTLLQDKIVLGVDQVSSENSNDPIVVNAVTLRVTPTEAKALTLAQQVGNLSLSLRNEGDSDADGSSTVALSDLWNYGPGEQPAASAASATTATSSQSAQSNDRRLVEVIRGLDVSQESLPPGTGGLTERSN